MPPDPEAMARLIYDADCEWASDHFTWLERSGWKSFAELDSCDKQKWRHIAARVVEYVAAAIEGMEEEDE